MKVHKVWGGERAWSGELTRVGRHAEKSTLERRLYSSMETREKTPTGSSEAHLSPHGPSRARGRRYAKLRQEVDEMMSAGASLKARPLTPDTAPAMLTFSLA